tara:strand:+ start:16692 stop:16931 length:240 start_codon:yes stop_codon:yes gene_type:complete
MPRFNDTQEFTYLENAESLALLTSHGANGVLTINSWDGLDWVVTDIISDTGGREIFVRGQRLKFVPENGMTYSIPEGTR